MEYDKSLVWNIDRNNSCHRVGSCSCFLLYECYFGWLLDYGVEKMYAVIDGVLCTAEFLDFQ